MEQWKLSNSVGGDINLAFVKIKNMSTVLPSNSIPRYMFEKFLHMYIRKHVKANSK